MDSLATNPNVQLACVFGVLSLPLAYALVLRHKCTGIMAALDTYFECRDPHSMPCLFDADNNTLEGVVGNPSTRIKQHNVIHAKDLVFLTVSAWVVVFVLKSTGTLVITAVTTYWTYYVGQASLQFFVTGAFFFVTQETHFIVFLLPVLFHYIGNEGTDLQGTFKVR